MGTAVWFVFFTRIERIGNHTADPELSRTLRVWACAIDRSRFVLSRLMSAIRLRAMKIGSVGFGQLIGTFALLAFATVAAAPSAVPADLSFVAVFVDAKTESRLGAFPFDR